MTGSDVRGTSLRTLDAADEQPRTEQPRTEQSRTEQSRTEQPVTGRPGSGLAGPFAALVSGRLGSAVLQAATLVLLAQQVAPATFALAAGVLGALALVSAVADLGVTAAVTRERARGATVAAQAALVRVNRLAAALAAVLTAAVLGTWAVVTGGTAQAQLLPLALWVLLERAAELRLAVAVADGRSAAAATNLLLRRCVAPLALGVGLLVGGVAPLLALSAGYAAGAGLSLAAARRGDAPREDAGPADPTGPLLPELRRTLTTTLPFWVNSVAAQSRQLDVLVVGLVAGPAAAAVYATPARLIGPLRLIPTTFAQALLPHTARGGTPDVRAVVRPLAQVLAATALLYGGLALVAPWLLATTLGPDYRGAATPLRVLLAGLLVAGVSSSLTSLLQGSGREARVAAANARNALVALVAVAAGAALGGGTGAALGLVVGYLAQCASLLLLAARPSTPRSTP